MRQVTALVSLFSALFVFNFSADAFAAADGGKKSTPKKSAAKSETKTTLATEAAAPSEKSAVSVGDSANEKKTESGDDRPKEGEAEKPAIVEEPVLPKPVEHDGLVSIHYAPIDLLLPSKIGGTLGWMTSEKAAWEFEYTRGSVAVPFLIKDLGKLEEDRFSLVRRWGGLTGFNWYFGAFYHRFRLTLGDEIMNRLSGGAYPSLSLLTIEGVGSVLGCGYRWLYSDRWLLGLEFIAWSQPWITTKRDAGFMDLVTNQNDKDNVDTALKVIQYFPRLSILKLSAGYAF